MRIIGNKENVDEIMFMHKGRGLKFKCFIKPLNCEQRLNLKESKGVEIIFDDLREVDSLIDMLERFRKESYEYIGEWRTR